MIVLNSTDVIRVVTGSAVTVDVVAFFHDVVTDARTPLRQLTAITTAATTTVVAAPSGQTSKREVSGIVIRNTHASSSNLVTVQLYDGSTAYQLHSKTLVAGASVTYTPDNGWGPVDLTIGAISTDTITESTAGAGVTVDGLLIKDAGIVSTAASGWTHSTAGNLVFDNQLVTGATYFTLGTDTSATEFAVRNNSETRMFLLTGDGALTISTTAASTWTHATAGDLTFDNTFATGSTIFVCGTDTTATDFQVQNDSAVAILTVTPESASGGTVSAQGLVAKSVTAAAITTTRTLTAADSGGVFSVAKTSAYAITLPTPAQGITFKFMALDTGAFAVTISDGSAHLFGQIQEAGTTPIAMTGTTLSMVATQAVGDWLFFQGIDATHYLVTGSSITASKFTIA